MELSEEVAAAVKKQALQAFPNETGGFLVGRYSDDGKSAIVEMVIAPPKSVAGPTSYQRETDGMNVLWDKLYDEGLIFLGEWHSHPQGSASYSSTDKTAMTNIATCKTVVIKNPIMLIVALSKKKVYQTKAYYYSNGDIVEYE